MQQTTNLEAPSSVTVFTRKDIMRLGVRTIERLLNFVPGFQGTTDNGNGVFRISVRGRNTTEHDYVLVLIDGQRLNDMFTGGAINPIAIENVEQVEIIRGPGSALYGANAFLGVIDIKTNRKRNNSMVASGDLNNRYVAINLANKLDALKVAAFVKHYRDDGYAQKFLDYAQGTMTFFHTKIDNLIQPPQNNLPYRNSGESIIQDLEFELRTREINGFSLLASYTHLMPREKEKTSLIVPYDYGAVALSYSWKMLLVSINAIMRGASKIGGFIATNIESQSFLVYDQPDVT
ncbi:MAG: TonB-dependent receptor plug domain-containing protein [Deltaproteobacteria bacterium]|nr:TonB-dependent receptor plug domain-containing protein [Deltaproteobacteria bacterium]